MQRPVPWLWIGLLGLLLLAPGASLRVVLDLLGGLTLVVVLLGVGGVVAAVVGLQLLRRRLKTCPACGTASFAGDCCPACGSSLSGPEPTDDGLDPRQATITVTATEVQDPNP